MSDKKHIEYPSRYAIGEAVYFVVGAVKHPAYIRAITFTNGKIRYTIYLKEVKSSIHNVDSMLVEDRVGESIEFNFDNYS
jgi:hypothetical protein